MPNLPSSPEEFVRKLITSAYPNTYRSAITNDNGTAVVLETELMLSKVKEVETIHFDATFSISL